MDFIRLPLSGSMNTRDLGGYPTLDGKITKFHIFLRSSNLKNITKDDEELLKKYGVTDIIDLRGMTNIQDSFISDDKIDTKYFNYHYIPISNKTSEDYIKNNIEKEEFDFGIAYYYMLENKEKIKNIFEVLANANGTVLYHCSAGKDRTGLITALIFLLCGVDKKDIVANYQVTYTYVKGQSFMTTYPPKVEKSIPKYIETFMEKLEESYNSAEEFLLSCDIKKDDLEKIKEKFLNEREY